MPFWSGLLNFHDSQITPGLQLSETARAWVPALGGTKGRARGGDPQVRVRNVGLCQQHQQDGWRLAGLQGVQVTSSTLWRCCGAGAVLQQRGCESPGERDTTSMPAWPPPHLHLPLLGGPEERQVVGSAALLGLLVPVEELLLQP